MHSSLNEFTVGPILQTDSTPRGSFRASEDGAVITSDGHGRFHELSSRGQIFCASTALAGTTVVAANVAPPAAGAATVLSILNPVGSGVNLEILQGWIRVISTTAGASGAGTWCWCGATTGVSITAAEATAIKRSMLIGQALAAFKAWSQVTLAGATVHVNVKPFPLCRVAAIAAATSWDLDHIDNVDGALVVPPGGLLSLAPAAQGTAVIVGAKIVLAQIPLPDQIDYGV